MSTIIAGHLPLQDQIEAARAALRAAGFADRQISAFYVNQPGQHDTYELGGDEHQSPGARETTQGVAEGAVTGAVIGAVAGAATTVVAGPLGPVIGGLVGAHVGSLYSFSDMKEAGEVEQGSARNQLAPRKPGMMIAVALPASDDEERALAVLHDVGADHIERAEGTIIDGDWRDFDPLARPVLLS